MSYATFAEVAETTSDTPVDETIVAIEEVAVEETVTATISSDLGYEVLVTVDESGTIITVEIFKYPYVL